jgi:hypothetical protein
MAALPRDLSELHLAPVVLSVDARLEELDQLSLEDLIVVVEGVDDRPVVYRAFREQALITAIEESTESHGWTFAWDPRGLRMTHNERSLVLGVPPSLMSYLSGVRPASSTVAEPAAETSRQRCQ